MSHYIPTERRPVDTDERVRWAQHRADEARQRARAHPHDRALQLAADARQREADAIRHAHARASEGQAIAHVGYRVRGRRSA